MNSDAAIAYINRLKLATKQLDGFAAEIRGDGVASFIYVSGPAGAAEISEASGKVWVEFWAQDSEFAAAEGEYADYGIALSKVRAWIAT